MAKRPKQEAVSFDTVKQRYEAMRLACAALPASKPVVPKPVPFKPKKPLSPEKQARRDKKLRQVAYAAYLKSEHWRLFKLRILALRGAACEICRSTNDIQLHHLTYERRGAELDSDVVLACKDCHARYHDKQTDEELYWEHVVNYGVMFCMRKARRRGITRAPRRPGAW